MSAIVSFVAVDDTRTVLRCQRCELNQFLPSSQKCRRCGADMAAPAEVIEFPRPKGDPIPWGKMVLQMRHKRGLSQLRVAMRMQVPRTFISKLEYRTQPPRVTTVLRLADALHVQVRELLPNAEEHCARESQTMLDDPFLRELAEASGGMDADQRAVVVGMARSLAEGQMMFEEWVALA